MPLYLKRDDPHWLEVAESLLLIFREGVGMTRGEIEAEVDELVGEGLATLAHRGLAKVLEDRAEFEVVADVPPEMIREKVFSAAAEHRRSLRSADGHRQPFRRDEVLGAVARRAGPRAREGRRLAVRRPQGREPDAPVRGPRRPPADRPLQRRAGAGGPAPLGPRDGRGPPREAGAVPAAVPPAQVPPAALPRRGEHGRGLLVPDRRPAEPVQRHQQVRPPDGPVPADPPALPRLPARRRAPLGPEARARGRSTSNRRTAWSRTRPTPARTSRPR